MAWATSSGAATPKKYITLPEACNNCPATKIEKTPYNLNIYDQELALQQRELDLLRDLVAAKDELIMELKLKLNRN